MTAAPANLYGPLGGLNLDGGEKISLWVTPGYEGRIKNCFDLYLTLAKNALADRPIDAPNPCMVSIDPTDEHVWAMLEVPL